MIRAIAVRTAVSVAIVNGLPLVLAAQTAKQGFETMAQTAEPQADCKVPKPPKDLAETAYIRNGYRAILRIMAAEKWQETKSCECFVTQITWEEVVKSGEPYRTGDDPKRPFDTSDLRLQADALEAEREKACVE